MCGPQAPDRDHSCVHVQRPVPRDPGRHQPHDQGDDQIGTNYQLNFNIDHKENFHLRSKNHRDYSNRDTANIPVAKTFPSVR